MSTMLGDVRNDAKTIFGTRKHLKDEDAYRRLTPTGSQVHMLPTIYGNNDYLLTSEAAWSGYQIPTKPWGFLSTENRRKYFHASNGVFNRIFPADKGSSGHLLVTNRVRSAQEWEQSLIDAYSRTAGENFARYVRESRKAIERREFFEREIYLFSRLGSRGESGTFRGVAKRLLESIAHRAGMDDRQPDHDEQMFWTQQAKSMEDTLGSSWLLATPIPRRRCEWLMRYLDSPALPTTETAPVDEQEWGAGKWRTVLTAETEEVFLGRSGTNHYRCVEFTAPTGEGKSYAAYLPVSNIPSNIHFEHNWLHHAAALPFPVDVSLHFEIIDPERALKAVQRPISAADDQQAEDAEAGVRTDDTTRIQQDELRQVKTKVSMARQPLAYWQAVLCVSDTDKDALLSKVNRLIKHFKDAQFELVCPPLDQRELFYQSFPGSDIRVHDWVHRTDPAYLAISQPWLSTDVGDRPGLQGLYQGHTITLDSAGAHQGVPVFFDLQNVVDDEGKAPTEVVTGFPGSGKRLSLSEIVATVNGFKAVGDLQVGDRLFDERGQACNVTALHPIENNPTAYRLTFDDGTEVLADAEHRWTTETRAARMSQRNTSRERRRAPKGPERFVEFLERLVISADPADETTPTLLQQRAVEALEAQGVSASGRPGAGVPGRDVFRSVAHDLEPVGSYVQSNHNGGGRRYPTYNLVGFCKALLEWAEGTMNDQRDRRVLPQTRTTAEIAETLLVDGGRPNHSIPVTAPVQYPERDLEVDPYVMGAWLGDGPSNGVSGWSSEDPEIIERVTSAGFALGAQRDRGQHTVYQVNGLVTALRPLEVLHNKHIPAEYLIASVEQRQALLQGLMDTDGSVTPEGTCEFHQSDKALAEQVRTLVASLGMKARLRSQPGTYVEAETGERIECKEAWTVSFAPTMQVFHLPRKAQRVQAHLEQRRSTTQRRYIVACEQVDPVPMRCITVDSPSHLYLATDQYIATHNTVSRGLKIAHEDCLRGITTLVWDPKGDFRPLKDHARRMQLDPAKVKLIDLWDPDNSVSLDPFGIAEVDPARNIDERPTAARSVLQALCREFVSDTQQGLTYGSILRQAVSWAMKQEERGQGKASMRVVMDRIQAWRGGDFEGTDIGQDRRREWQDCCQQVAEHLVDIEQGALGRLLFRDAEEVGSLKVSQGDLVLFQAIGLETTGPGEEQTAKTLVPDVISGLMTDYIRSLLHTLPDHVAKSLIFDEWHVIKRVGRAEALLAWLKRMGRSKRCMVRQMSQSALDFDKGSLSVVWAGYAQNDEEAAASCDLLGIEASTANKELIQNLHAGQFLFRDVFGRVAMVQVDIWDDWLLDRFNTQAAAKEKATQEPELVA